MAGDWTNDPAVADWLHPADDRDTTPAVEHDGEQALAYSEPTVDRHDTGSDADVRGGVGIDDPTEQFTAPTFDDVDTTGTHPVSAGAAARAGEATVPPPAGHVPGESMLGLTMPSASAPPRRRGGRATAWARQYRVPLMAVGAVVVALVGALAIMGLSGNDSDTDKTADGPGIAIPSASGASPVPAAANADCPTTTKGPVSTGRDAGGTDSGPNVIKGFEYAYYVTRSGDQARAMVTPNAKSASGAPFSSGAQLQASIDKFIDPQTLHCVSITDRGAGLYAVDLTETPPRGETPAVYHQLIQTTTDRGRSWIVSITDADTPAP